MRPIGNKEHKKPIGDEDKRLIRMWYVQFETCLATFMIEVAMLNGFVFSAQSLLSPVAT
jgi:hypothetical protein